MTTGRPPRVYLDVRCLNRPLNDLRQERVRREAEAVVWLLAEVQQGRTIWISSEVVKRELRRTPTADLRLALLRLLELPHERVEASGAIVRRAEAFARLGLRSEDATHLACAEAAGVDAFLTTDDRLLRVVRRNVEMVHIPAVNPRAWAAERGGADGR